MTRVASSDAKCLSQRTVVHIAPDTRGPLRTRVNWVAQVGLWHKVRHKIQRRPNRVSVRRAAPSCPPERAGVYMDTIRWALAAPNFFILADADQISTDTSVSDLRTYQGLTVRFSALFKANIPRTVQYSSFHIRSPCAKAPTVVGRRFTGTSLCRPLWHPSL